MPTPESLAAEILARLVAHDTTSRLSNRPLIEEVARYLAAHGIEAEVMPAPDGMANLFATIGGSGEGGIALSGHTDCVPVDGQVWTGDPFTLAERNGRLYGRGSCDMKGFIASVLAAVPDFVSRPLKVPLHIMLTYDEEVTCRGARQMAGALGRDLPMPRAVIVGEPTGMEVVDAHKSVSIFTTTVTGRAAHSSAPEAGANTIFAAAALIGELARMRDEMVALGDPSGRFDPPYTTVHVGTIGGGTAVNIIPQETRFQWEIRAVPGFDEAVLEQRFSRFAADHVLPALTARAPEAGIVTELFIHAPKLAPEPGSLAEQVAMHCAGRNHTGVAGYGTEAGFFQGLGIPTIVCGPGDIAQAHQPDEFLELSQLEKCNSFLRRLADLAERGL